jgi:hypothetical protein
MKKGAEKRTLYCCICGEYAGRHEQHWNRDTGWGICPRCATEQVNNISVEEMKSLFGVEGVNYSLVRGEEEAK